MDQPFFFGLKSPLLGEGERTAKDPVNLIPMGFQAACFRFLYRARREGSPTGQI
jgi:hypothetical protein